MSEHAYRVIVCTRLFPDGVQYPASGEQLYTRDGDIEMLERLVFAGHRSDMVDAYGCWAESPNERFTLADIAHA